MKKILYVLLVFMLIISIPVRAMAKDSDDASLIVIGEVIRNPETEYSYEELTELYPEVEFSDKESFIYCKEAPIKTYELYLNDYDVLHLNIFSDGSYTYSGTFTLKETSYYDAIKKEYLTRSLKTVSYSDGNPVYGYTMNYAVNYTHNSTAHTITINSFYVTGTQTNVSVNSIHYHRSGGSQYSTPAVFTAGNYATMHGHYGLYVSDPVTGEQLQSGSMVLEWKIKANSNGTVTAPGEYLVGPYTNFYYMD